MIGLLGGTFDPIHYGHLLPAQEVMRRLGLRRLHLIPAAQPPHRTAPLATAVQRLRMVELAAAEFPGFVADGRELECAGPSYTVLTLASMRNEIATEPLCLLVGADAFVMLHTWHRWTELFDLAHVVVMARPGAPTPSDAHWPNWARERMVHQPSDLEGRAAGAVSYVAVAPLSVSASQIRDKIARGEMPSSNDLPATVWEYIRQHHLYRSHAH